MFSRPPRSAREGYASNNSWRHGLAPMVAGQLEAGVIASLSGPQEDPRRGAGEPHRSETAPDHASSGIHTHATRPPPSSVARLASRNRLIKSVRLIRAISTVTISMLRNPTNVELLMPAKVSHNACKTTAVA